MGLFSFFKREKREFKPIGEKDELSKVLNGESAEESYITKEMAIQIPPVKTGVNFIADLVSSLEIKLYKETDGKVNTIDDDYRLKLLNDETGDLLNSYQMKQSLVRDFLLSGNGYIYINKIRNKIESLHYVENTRVSIIPGVDPIFKDGKILVNGKYYDPYEFIIFAQNSSDGLQGKGILDECGNLLELSYNTLAFASNNIAAGGIKRGVVKSSKRLSQEAMDALKQAWSNLYSGNGSKNSNAIILNDGLDFHELSQTATELEALDTRKQNDNDILNIIKVPANILNGTASQEQYNNFIKSTIIPVLQQLESSFNKALLLESEKSDRYFFAFETKDLLKGSAKERFETYKAAIESGVLMPNECRFMENYDSVEGLDVIKMSLGHVLYNPDTKGYYVPNTGQVVESKNTHVKEVNTDGSEKT